LPVYTLLRRSLIAQPTQTDISAVEKWFDDNRQPFPSFPHIEMAESFIYPMLLIKVVITKDDTLLLSGNLY
jgi:hypothetical protein